MARKLFTDKLIPKSEIKEELRLVPGSEDTYVSRNGDFYADYGNDMLLPKKASINGGHGYRQIGIRLKGSSRITTKRAHRLVAEAWIPNPDNLPIVGHRNNDKTDNRVENLYWTTTAANTQKAYDDGLAANDSGWDDSQSIPVCQFDLNGNLIKEFGSISQCAAATGMTKTGILYQCNHKLKGKPRKGYYFRYYEEYQERGFVL